MLQSVKHYQAYTVSSSCGSSWLRMEKEQGAWWVQKNGERRVVEKGGDVGTAQKGEIITTSRHQGMAEMYGQNKIKLF